MNSLFFCLLLFVFINYNFSLDPLPYCNYEDKNCFKCRKVKINVPNSSSEKKIEIKEKIYCAQCNRGFIVNSLGVCVICPRPNCYQCSSNYFDNVNFEKPLNLPTKEQTIQWATDVYCSKCNSKKFGWYPLKNAGCQNCPKDCTDGCDHVYPFKNINFTDYSESRIKIKEIITSKDFNHKYMQLLCRCPKLEIFNIIHRKCEKCPQGCSRCLIDKTMICQENSCLKGYTFQKDVRLCKPNVIPNCEKIYLTKFENPMSKRIDLKYICGKCADGFTLHLTKEKCVPCPKGCNHCSIISAKNGENLTAIIDSSIVHNMLPTLKPSDISIFCNCKDAEVYIPESKACKSCSFKCESCYYGTIGRLQVMLIVCRKCSEGYSLFNNKCLINCKPGYYRDTKGNCQPCLEGCTKCTATKCLECPKGKQFALDVRKCVDCGLASKGCQKCYYRVEGKNLTYIRQFSNYGSFEYEDKPALICTDRLTRECKPQDVFFLGTGNCERCENNCGKCLVSFNEHFALIKKCALCIKGYRQYNIFGKLVCIPICPLGQGFLNIKGSCQKCPLNCENCFDSSHIYPYIRASFLECLKCEPGTFLNIDRKSCISCSNPPFNYFCGKCELVIRNDKYRISVSDMLIKTATISPKLRDSRTIISRECLSTQCPPMYYRTEFSCERCANDCYRCQFENGKEICLDKKCSTKLVNGKCLEIKKLAPVKKIMPIMIIKCSRGYINNKDNTRCLKCPDNCADCRVNSIDAAECLKCNAGYAFNFKSRMCVSCGTIGKCKECFYVNHYKDSRKLNSNIWNRLNKPIPEKEKVTQTKFQCSTDFLIKCKEGYTFSMLALMCVKCPSHCDSTKKCMINYKESRIDCICKPGYTYDTVKKTCYKGCLPKFYLEKRSNKCYPCPSTCKTCGIISGVLRCTSCFYGHYLHYDLRQCRICPLNAFKKTCSICYIRERTGKKISITEQLEKNVKENTAPAKREESNMEVICTQNECPKNMIWNFRSRTCEILPCPSICKSCSQSNRCEVECDPKTCKNCYVKNEICYNDIGFLKEKQVELKKFCKSCDKAQVLTLNGYQCLNCPSNCAKCSYGYNIGTIFINITKMFTERGIYLKKSKATLARLKCEACAERYTYNPGFRVCTKCPQNCMTCVPGESEQIVCKICDKGYDVAKDGSCVTPLPVGCLFTTRKDYCVVCAKNYILRDGKCKLCQEGCESCLLISKSTYRPLFFEFYFKPIENVNEICTSCYFGFYMDNGVCKRCAKGCANCIMNEKTRKLSCSSCFPNYIMRGLGICSKCPSGCDSCYDTSDKNFKMNKIVFDYTKNGCENCKVKNSFVAIKNSQKICVSKGDICEVVTNCVKCERNFIGIKTQRILRPDYYYGMIFTEMAEIREFLKRARVPQSYDFNSVEKFMKLSIPNYNRVREIKEQIKIFGKIPYKFVYEEKYVAKWTPVNSRINEVCLKCEPGFHLRKSTGKCDKCVDDCTNCVLDKNKRYICKACVESYYLDNNQCKRCPKGCSKCEKKGEKIYCKTKCKSNQVFNPITSKCVDCGKNCKDKKCEYSPVYYISHYKYQISNNVNHKYPLPLVKTSDKCILCLKEGYYYEKKVKGCLKCLGNCKTCLNKYTCTACDNDNYQLKHGKCYLNSCKKGEFNDGKGCKPCKSPCSLCVDKEDKCTRCQDKNHVLIDNKCQERVYLLKKYNKKAPEELKDEKELLTFVQVLVKTKKTKEEDEDICVKNEDCKNKGICKKKICKCKKPFWGDNCEFGQTEKKEQEKKTTEVLIKVKALINGKIDKTQANNYAKSIKFVVKIKEGFTKAGLADVLESTKSLISKVGKEGNTELLNTLSDIIEINDNLKSEQSVEEKKETKKKIISYITENTESLLKKVTEDNKPVVIKTKKIQVKIVQMDLDSDEGLAELNNLSSGIPIANEEVDGIEGEGIENIAPTKVKLSQELIDDLKKKETIKAVVTSCAIDPYEEENYELQTCNVKVDLKDKSNDEIKVENLKAPIEISIPMKTHSDKKTFVCMFRDKKKNKWSKRGLTFKGRFKTVIVCRTTHLTEFGSIGITPTKTPQTISNDTPMKNFIGLYFSIALIVLFIFSLFIARSKKVKEVKHYSKPGIPSEENEDLKKEVERGEKLKFRDVLEIHPFVGISRSNSGCEMIEKIAILFAYVFCLLGMSSLVFYLTIEKENNGAFALSSFVGLCCAWGIKYLLAFVLRKYPKSKTLIFWNMISLSIFAFFFLSSYSMYFISLGMASHWAKLFVVALIMDLFVFDFIAIFTANVIPTVWKLFKKNGYSKRNY